jgi:hypothetical protein
MPDGELLTAHISQIGAAVGFVGQLRCGGCVDAFRMLADPLPGGSESGERNLDAKGEVGVAAVQPFDG